MSTSDLVSCPKDRGFTAIELLIGLSLTLCIALAGLALWESLDRTGTAASDGMIRLLQGRVAVTRLSRDLRLASGQGCQFKTSGPLLEAKSNQIVVLSKASESGLSLMVEWELVQGNLMRRKGDCPLSRPGAFTHSLFSDHKTMLEGLKTGSRFRFFASGIEEQAPVAVADLGRIDEIRLEAVAGARQSGPAVDVAATSLLGR
ncbi:MAG: hypothetical protein M1274_11540 [Actinobacteria bacterium]|nr:hypothetical protein [Actinomycetota bacterium]